MKLHTALAVVGTTAVVGSGAVLLPIAASAHPATHTLKFESVTEKMLNFSAAHAAQLDVDRNSAGKLIGFDTTNVSFGGKTGRGYVVVNTKQGLIEVALKLGSSGVTGTVVGGTGGFKHATGTATVQQLNKSDSKAEVTIKYAN